MNFTLVGQGNVYNKKSYSVTKDEVVSSVVPSTLGLKDDWYGGMVKVLYLTKDGVYICCDKKENIVNILVPEVIQPYVEASTSEVDMDIPTDRKSLLELAKELGVEGKIATMKTDDLIDKIKEIKKEGDSVEKEGQ